MITYQGQRYAIDYVGNVEIEEIAGASLAVDAWGLDQCTRKYKGALTKLSAFLATLRRDRFKPDPHYPALTLAQYVATENGPWAEVDVTYKGTFDGNLPQPPPPDSGVSVESVSLSLLTNDGPSSDSPTVQLTYYAPTTTWRYVARRRPVAPQFLGKLEGAKEIKFLTRRGAYGNLQLFSGGNLEDQVSVDSGNLGDYNGIALSVTKGPIVRPAGIYFECEETVQRLIYPLELAQIRWKLTL